MEMELLVITLYLRSRVVGNFERAAVKGPVAVCVAGCVGCSL